MIDRKEVATALAKAIAYQNFVNMKEVLVSASLGLMYCSRNDTYYAQVISAAEYKFYYFPLSPQDAKAIALNENLLITIVTELP